MTEPQKPMEDTLLRLYDQASAQDPRGPAPRVADAIRTHARVVAAAGDGSAAPALATPHEALVSANHPRWKTSLLASIAVIGLAGMLFLQFDRGTPQEQDPLRGQPGPQVAAPIRSQDPAARAVASSGALAQARSSSPAAAPGDRARDTFAGPKSQATAGTSANTEATVAAPTQDLVATPRSLAAVSDAGISKAKPAPVLTLGEVARAGRVDELDAILASGAAIDGRDADGRTPLMLAAIHGHREMVRRLLAAGADRRLRDPADQTAAQLARAAGHAQLADLIAAGS